MNKVTSPVKPTKKELQQEEKQERKDYLLSLFPKVSSDHKGLPKVYCVTTHTKPTNSGSVTRFMKLYVCVNNEIIPITNSVAIVTGDKLEDCEIKTTSDYAETVMYLSWALYGDHYQLGYTSM